MACQFGYPRDFRETACPFARFARGDPTVRYLMEFRTAHCEELGAQVEYAAFMVVREAVENALRHSGASAIAVELSGNALLLHLTVSDNGVGLPEGVGLGVGHLGILGMQERAQAVRASVSYARGQEPGTRVAFHWQCAS